MIPVRRILRYRLQAEWNRVFRSGSFGRAVFAGVMFVILLGFLAGLGVGAGAVLARFLGEPQRLHGFLTALFLSTVVLVIVGQVRGVAAQMSDLGESHWLRRGPVSGRRILLAQLAEAVVVLGVLPALGMVPLFLGLVLRLRPDPGALLVGAGAFLWCVVTPLGGAAALAAFLAPRVTTDTLRRLEALVGAGLAAAILWVYWGADRGMAEVVEGIALRFPDVDARWFPPAALARVVAAYLAQRPVSADAALALTAHTVFLFGLPAAVLLRRGGPLPEARMRASRRVRSVFLPGGGGVVAVVARRDLLLFLRDPRIGFQVLLSGGLVGVVLLGSTLRSGEMAGGFPAVIAAAAYTTFLAASLTFPAERRAVVWTAGAPVPPGRLVLGKLAAALIAAAPVWGLLLLGVAMLRHWTGETVVSLALFLPGSLALGGSLGLWLGAVHARFDWTRPGEALGTFGGCLSTVVIVLLLSLSGGLSLTLEVGGGTVARTVGLLYGGLGVGIGALILRRVAGGLRRRDWLV